VEDFEQRWPGEERRRNRGRDLRRPDRDPIPGQAEATTTVHELVRGEVHADSALGEAGTSVYFEQYGIYYDDVAKLDGEWKFTHRLFVPVYLRTDCVTGPC
jgi:hypothetical protein